MSLADKWKKYKDLCHAMQTGVAFTMGQPTEPKHLRVGVNVALSNDGALVALLMEKGIITEEEYVDRLIEYMEREVARYKEELGGAKVTLV